MHGTYNYATWGITKAQTEELDRAHRKQLRKVTRNPFMKNNRLYEITKETPLSEQMGQARWRLLGHILRLDRNTPCQKAVDHYFEVPECAKKHTGKARTTLPIVIADDMRLAEISKININITKQFIKKSDLEGLRVSAKFQIN